METHRMSDLKENKYIQTKEAKSKFEYQGLNALCNFLAIYEEYKNLNFILESDPFIQNYFITVTFKDCKEHFSWIYKEIFSKNFNYEGARFYVKNFPFLRNDIEEAEILYYFRVYNLLPEIYFPILKAREKFRNTLCHLF